MKKICYVVTIPFTIRSFFIPQLQYLSDNGFDVSVVCNDDGIIEGELGEKIHFHGENIPRGLSIIGSIKATTHLISYFKKERFDLIQYSTPNAAFYSAIASKIAGCKVRNYHLMGYRYLGGTGLHRIAFKAIEKITCAISTSIECVSKSNLEFGVSEGLFNREKATVVWNGSTGGVDLKRFDFNKRSQWRSELRKEYGYNEDDFVYGFVGRITRDKGINELLEAFFRLNDNSKLIIVGNNEHDGSVDAELWNRALSNPDILVHNPSDEIEKYYAMIDVLVAPSYREGFGNVIIEASAMGTPPIASNIPGPNDYIIDNVNGMFCLPRNSSSVLKALLEIKENNRSQIGIAAKENVETKFDSSMLVKYIVDRKNNLLDKAR